MKNDQCDCKNKWKEPEDIYKKRIDLRGVG